MNFTPKTQEKILKQANSVNSINHKEPKRFEWFFVPKIKGFLAKFIWRF